MESLAAYMWSEYEMTLNQAKELKKEELSSLPEIRRQIDALKRQIKSLGNINVNAIEDYREVSERYEFMRAQHEDLVNAQAELEKIIEELDIGMRRQFEEKFRRYVQNLTKYLKNFSVAAGRPGINGRRRSPGSRNSDHRPASGQEASEHDAAFRW